MERFGWRGLGNLGFVGDGIMISKLSGIDINVLIVIVLVSKTIKKGEE